MHPNCKLLSLLILAFLSIVPISMHAQNSGDSETSSYFMYQGIRYHSISITPNLVEVVDLGNGEKYKGDIVIPSKVVNNGMTWSVYEIGLRAFAECEELTSVKISDGVRYLNVSAFYKCNSLTSVILPSTLAEIYSWAFAYCTSLEAIELPQNLNKLYRYTFTGSGLKSIKIPGSIQEFEGAFLSCGNLETVVLEEGITTIGDGTFAWCENLRNISLPSSLNTIVDEAFAKCISLPKITIPSHTERIGTMAFSGCEKLTEISCEASVPPVVDVLDINHFDDPHQLTNKEIYAQCKLIVPESSTMVYANTYPWNQFSWINNIAGAENVTSGSNMDVKIIHINGDITTFAIADKPEVSFVGDDVVIKGENLDLIVPFDDILSFSYHNKTESGIIDSTATQDRASISIYHKMIHINLPDRDNCISIYSVNGMNCKNIEFREAGEYDISMETFASGIYIVKINNQTIKVNLYE